MRKLSLSAEMMKEWVVLFSEILLHKDETPPPVFLISFVFQGLVEKRVQGSLTKLCSWRTLCH